MTEPSVANRCGDIYYDPEIDGPVDAGCDYWDEPEFKDILGWDALAFWKFTPTEPEDEDEC